MSLITREFARRALPRSIRNILRAPGRALWWAMTDARHRLGLDERVEIRPGFTIRSHPAAYALAYHDQHDDPEQLKEFDGFVRACSPGMLLFDVGAHFGLFSLAAMHYGGVTARAVAVDASPTAADMVRTQGSLNGLGARLSVVNAAAGAEAGWIEMIATGAMGAGYFVAPNAEHGASERTRTPVVTIDMLATQYGVPTHIKIDIEGFEGDALRGGERTLTLPSAPLLFLELHHQMITARGGDAAEPLRLLREFGYALQEIDGTPISEEAVLARPLCRMVATPTYGSATRGRD